MRKSLKKKQIPIIYKEGYQDNFNNAKLNTRLFKYFVKREKNKIQRNDFIEIEFKSLITDPSTNIKLIKNFLFNDLPKVF